MTNFPEKNKRVWQCFVCGMEFKETYEEFKAHVLKEHEEGREFIRCPSCDAPVRDMRLHFKLKHPQMQIPKSVPMRAIVWRDQKGKTSVKTKPQEGYHKSPKNPKELHYRSKFEKTVYELLDKDKDVIAYAVEPITINYFFNGKVRGYIPDIVVQYYDGRKEIWEVKPSCQTTLPINKAKWKYAEEYCEQRGFRFEVITETRRSQLEKKVRDQAKDAPFNDFFGGKEEQDSE